jgi:hypothetical protein
LNGERLPLRWKTPERSLLGMDTEPNEFFPK